MLQSMRSPARKTIHHTSSIVRSIRHLTTTTDTPGGVLSDPQPPSSSHNGMHMLPGLDDVLSTANVPSNPMQSLGDTIADLPGEEARFARLTLPLPRAVKSQAIRPHTSEEVDLRKPGMPRRTRINRQEMLIRLNEKIQRHYGRQYRVEPFGSTCYGAATSRSADVDISILDWERPFGFEPSFGKLFLPPIYDMNHLAEFLSKEGYEIKAVVANASVPIVKLYDPMFDVSSDINVNHRLGVYNTALLRRYCLLLSPLASLIRMIKIWAQTAGLNSPTDARPSFSSYSLTLMTIAQLQHQGRLPNLQADKASRVDTYFWVRTRSGSRKKIDIRYGSCSTWKEPPRFDRRVALLNWFKYWGKIHDYESEDIVVSIRDGGLVSRDAATKIPPPRPREDDASNTLGRLVVMDPFMGKNCTSRISQNTLLHFQSLCKKQYYRMLDSPSIRRTEVFENALGSL